MAKSLQDCLKKAEGIISRDDKAAVLRMAEGSTGRAATRRLYHKLINEKQALYDEVEKAGGNPEEWITRLEEEEVDFQPELTEAGSAIEREFFEYLNSLTMDELILMYSSMESGQGSGAFTENTDNGKVINADAFRELFDRYRKNRLLADPAHEPASALTKKYLKYTQGLAQKGDQWMLLSGGPAAGKGTTRGLSAVWEGADMIFDGTMSNFEKDKRTKVKALLDKDVRVHFLYVYQDPMTAFVGSMRRAMDQKKNNGSGRVVNKNVFIDGTYGANVAIRQFYEEYRNHPLVSFEFFNNEPVVENGEVTSYNPHEIDFSEIPQISKADLTARISEYVEELRATGEIDDETFRYTVSSPWRKGQEAAGEVEQGDIGGPATGDEGARSGARENAQDQQDTGPLFARNRPSVTPEAQQNYARMRMALAVPIRQLAGTLNVSLLQTADEIPPDARPADDPDGNTVEGLWLRGTNEAFLVAENMDVQRAQQVLAHEAFGHAAMEQMPEFTKILDSIQNLKAVGNKTITTVAARVAASQPNLDSTTEAKEILATMAEMGVKSTTMDRAISAVRGALRRIFGVDLDFNEAEIRQLLVEGARGLQANARAKRAALAAKPLAQQILEDPGAVEAEIRNAIEEIYARSVMQDAIAGLHEELADIQDPGADPRAARIRAAIEQIENAPTAAPDVLFQTAYHGTGAPEFDRFDIKYIGTGEGVAAYGWGLYFSDMKGVADWYRHKLSRGYRYDYGDKKGLSDAEVSAEISVDLYDEMRRLLPEDATDEQLASMLRWATEIAEAGLSMYRRHRGSGTDIKKELESQRDNQLKAAEHYRNMVAEDKSPGNIYSKTMFQGIGWGKLGPEGVILRAEAFAEAYDRAIELVGNRLIGEKVRGTIFKVDVPHDDDLLDWRQPLTAHSDKVQDKIKARFPDLYKEQWMNGFGRPILEPGLITQEMIDKLGKGELERRGYIYGRPVERMNGEALYQWIHDDVVNDTAPQANVYHHRRFERTRSKRASLLLRDEVGIPGHIYEGATSREKDYVIYDDAEITILDAAPHVDMLYSRAQPVLRLEPTEMGGQPDPAVVAAGKLPPGESSRFYWQVAVGAQSKAVNYDRSSWERRYYDQLGELAARKAGEARRGGPEITEQIALFSRSAIEIEVPRGFTPANQGKRKLTVLKNPTAQELRVFVSNVAEGEAPVNRTRPDKWNDDKPGLRWFQGDDGNYYFWDAAEAIHRNVSRGLGVNMMKAIDPLWDDNPTEDIISREDVFSGSLRGYTPPDAGQMRNRPAPAARPMFSRTPRPQMELDEDIQENGIPIENMADADKLWSDGYLIYAFNEMDEQPSEVTSIEQLHNNVPDRLVALPPKPEILPGYGPLSADEVRWYVARDRREAPQQPQAPVHTDLSLEDQEDMSLSESWSYFSRGRVRGDDEIEAIRAHVLSPANEDITIKDRMRDVVNRLFGVDWLNVKQGMIDSAAVVESIERGLYGDLQDAAVSPYKAVLATKNLGSVMAAVMHKGVPILREGVFQPRRGRQGLVEIFTPITQHADGNLLPLWELYAVARRAERLIGEKNPDGTSKEKRMTPEQIEKAKALGQQYPEFETAFLQWNKFNQQVLDLAVKTGVINQDERKVWAKNDYVPFYRAMEEIEGVEGEGPRPRGRGVEGVRSGIKRLSGSDAQIGHVFENMVMNTAYLVDASFRNDAMQRIVLMTDGIAMEKIPMAWEAIKIKDGDMARALMKAGLLVVNGETVTDMFNDALMQVRAMTPEQKEHWSTVFRRVAPTGPDVVSVLINGKPVYYRVDDPLLLRTIQGMGAHQWGGIMNMFRFSKKLLTSAVTIDPAFMLANFVRDTLSSWVVADTGGAVPPLLEALKGAKAAFTEDEDTIKIMMAGAGGGGFYDHNPADVRKMLAKKLPQGQVDSFMNSIITPRGAWRFWQKIGNAAEQANRVAKYRKVIAEGGSAAEAAYAARDILNFSMSGDFAAMKFLVQTVPFLNARIQGLYRLYRGGKEHPLGFAYKGGAIMAATMALLLRNMDDERYEELPEWDKDVYWHLFVGDEHFRLPKPFEIGAMYATVPERAIRAMSGRDDWDLFGQRMIKMFAETLQFNPTPQLLKPVVEQYANRNMFTGAPLVGFTLSNLKPEAQYDHWTSETMREWADAMPDFAPSWLRSPKRLEAAVRGYTGAMGMYVLGAADSVTRRALGHPDRPTKALQDYPVITRFWRNPQPRTSKYTTQLYDMMNEADALYRTLNAYSAQGRLEDVQDLLEGQQGKLAARKYLHGVANQLREINNQMKIIAYSDMSAEEKRAAMDKLNAAKMQAVRQVAHVGELF